jgi:hypothetical protein
MMMMTKLLVFGILYCRAYVPYIHCKPVRTDARTRRGLCRLRSCGRRPAGHHWLLSSGHLVWPLWRCSGSLLLELREKWGMKHDSVYMIYPRFSLLFSSHTSLISIISYLPVPKRMMSQSQPGYNTSNGPTSRRGPGRTRVIVRQSQNHDGTQEETRIYEDVLVNPDGSYFLFSERPPEDIFSFGLPIGPRESFMQGPTDPSHHAVGTVHHPRQRRRPLHLLPAALAPGRTRVYHAPAMHGVADPELGPLSALHIDQR